MALIRGSALLGFRDLVTDLGGDPIQVLRLAGIRPRDAGDHDAFLPYRALAVALEEAARVTREPGFGRSLSLRQGIGILGPVGVAARTAPTVGEALRICSVYLGAYSPAIRVERVPFEREDRTLLEFAIVASDIPRCPQLFELSVGVQLQVLRHLCGPSFRPVAALLPHAALDSRRRYRDHYGSSVCFSQARSGVMLRDADLDRAVGHDAQAHEVLVRYLEGLDLPEDQGLASPVRRLVRELLPTGAVSMELMAQQFLLHPKTFQRRLTAEGTTFGALVEQARRELARHYLRDTDLELTQIARELGYAEQSVFSRSCRRWFDVPPATLRQDLRAQ